MIAKEKEGPAQETEGRLGTSAAGLLEILSFLGDAKRVNEFMPRGERPVPRSPGLGICETEPRAPQQIQEELHEGEISLPYNDIGGFSNRIVGAAFIAWDCCRERDEQKSPGSSQLWYLPEPEPFEHQPLPLQEVVISADVIAAKPG